MMKLIKVVVFSVLITIGFLLVGEVNLLNIWSFQEQYYSADFYIPDEQSDELARKHVDNFIDAANETDVDFFAIEYQWDTAYKNTTNIIGTSNAIKALRKSGINEGVNSSLLFPSEQVEFIDVNSLNDISNSGTFYFIGDEADYESICEFKSKLIDRYGGGFPHEKGSSHTIYVELIALWGIIYFCNLLLAWYEAKALRKENMLKAIMGRNILAHFLRGLILESIAFIFIYIAVRHFLLKVSYVDYKIQISTLLFVIYVLLNAVIGYQSVKMNYKQALFDDGENQRILKINYFGKSILAVVVIAAMSVSATIAINSYKISVQKDFFNKHKDYSYYKLGYSMSAEPEDGDELPEERMYKAFYEKFQDCALQYLDLTGNYNVKYPFVTINRKAFLELCSEYQALNQIEKDVLKNKISILFPADMSETSRDYLNAIEMNDGTYYSEDEYGMWNTEKYEATIKVEAIHHDGKTYQMHQYTNPVILVNNIEYSNESVSGYDCYNNYDVMYKIPFQKFQDFANRFDIEDNCISITSVNDEFEYVWNQEIRKLKVSLLLFIILMILGVFSSILIISMEYSINAMEMAIMKTLGYSVIDRNIKIIKLTVIANLIGMLISIALCIALKLKVSLVLLLLMTLLLMVLELAIIIIKACVVERKRVTTILKGESV